MTDHVETVVIGAGVVGLAIARTLALAGQEVVILDRAEDFGTETSSRHSEVIHAGIYYPTGSLKARACVAGKHLLYDYLDSRGIAHSRLGKLIVATDDSQIPALAQIKERAEANGVPDLEDTASGSSEDCDGNGLPDECELDCDGDGVVPVMARR